MNSESPLRASATYFCLALAAVLLTTGDAVSQGCGLVKLFAPNPLQRATLGTTVSISGDHFVADAPRAGTAYIHRRGASGDWEMVQWVSRPQGSNGEASIDDGFLLLGMRNSDPVVYRLEADRWVWDGVLRGSRLTDSYGQFSALGGRVAVVGDSEARTAHFFHRGEAGWIEEQLIRDVGAWNVATDGERALIGDSFEGRARVFRRIADGDGPGEWVLEATLIPADGCAVFGSGVAIRGDLALVGSAPDFARNPCARAYVFRRDGEQWVEEQILEEQGVTPAERFAGERGVAIGGDRLVVNGGTGCCGNTHIGSAYVYRHDGRAFVLETKITPPQRLEDAVAWSVAVGDDTVLIGAPDDGTRASRAGAVYVQPLAPAGLEALFSMTEQPVAGESLTFDATESAIPEGAEVVAYEWDFGDGETTEGPVAEHAYARAGRYEVTLRLVTADARCVHRQLRVDVLCTGDDDIDVAPWTSEDVGEPAFAGSARFLDESGALEICAGGSRIAFRSDEFHFVHQEVTGDVFLRVRVDEFAADPGAQTGVMVRGGLGAGMPHGVMLVEKGVSAASTSSFRFKHRQEDGGAVRSVSGDRVPALPVWVEVRRQGAEVIGLSSPDGVNWTEVGRVGIALPGPLRLGVVLAGRDDDPEASFAAAAARFSDLEGSFTGSAPVLFRRGDANADGTIDLSDGLFALDFLFASESVPPCMKAVDADDTDSIELTDAVFIFGHLFLGDSPPPPPFLECGEDPTGGELACASYPPCAA